MSGYGTMTNDIHPRLSSAEVMVNLRKENGKLRELVHKVEHYEQYGCYECPHSSSCGASTLFDDDCTMSREIEREKRELGIEVDE